MMTTPDARPGRSSIGAFAASALFVVLATVLHVMLSRTIVVIGPFSTLGVVAAAYLVATWCVALGFVLLAVGKAREGSGTVAGAFAWVVVLVAAVITGVLGPAAVASASTPMFIYPSSVSSDRILLRLGDGISNDRLQL